MTLLIAVEAHFGDDYKENNQKPQIYHDYVVQELLQSDKQQDVL